MTGSTLYLLSGLEYYVLTLNNTYNVLVFILYCKTPLLLLRWDAGKVRDWLASVGRFKGGLRCTGWVNSVTTNAITETNWS